MEERVINLDDFCRYLAVADDLDIDYSFILCEERGVGGIFSGVAFVPADSGGVPLARSGITFSGGVDIGQMGASELRVLCGERVSLYDKLRDYVGVCGVRGLSLLRRYPLRIGIEDLVFLTGAKYGRIYREVESLYESDRGGVNLSFGELSCAMRTVILSVAVQYGAVLRRRTPRFWRCALAADGEAMIAELSDFGDNYGSRRRREAAYLRAAMTTAEV